MDSDPKIILFNIPLGKHGAPIHGKSGKPNEIRPLLSSQADYIPGLVLDYNSILYRSQWIKYPDVEPTLKSLGGTPTMTSPDEGHPTLPATLDTSGETPALVIDSFRIAEYLDAKYTERSVFPEKGKEFQYMFEDLFNNITTPLFSKILLPLSWRILNPRSQVHFRNTREEWYGKGRSLEEWSPEGSEREKDWALLRQGFDIIATLLNKNGPESPFVAGGTEPTRADMIIISHLAWIVASSPEDWEESVKTWNDGRWNRLWRASEPWRTVAIMITKLSKILPLCMS